MSDWITGSFEGTYRGTPGRPPPGMSGDRWFDVRLVHGTISEAKPADAPPPVAPGEPAPFVQDVLPEAQIASSGPQGTWESRALHDVQLRHWRIVDSAEVDHQTYAKLTGTVYARLAPRPTVRKPIEEEPIRLSPMWWLLAAVLLAIVIYVAGVWPLWIVLAAGLLAALIRWQVWRYFPTRGWHKLVAFLLVLAALYWLSTLVMVGWLPAPCTPAALVPLAVLAIPVLVATLLPGRGVALAWTCAVFLVGVLWWTHRYGAACFPTTMRDLWDHVRSGELARGWEMFTQSPPATPGGGAGGASGGEGSGAGLGGSGKGSGAGGAGGMEGMTGGRGGGAGRGGARADGRWPRNNVDGQGFDGQGQGGDGTGRGGATPAENLSQGGRRAGGQGQDGVDLAGQGGRGGAGEKATSPEGTREDGEGMMEPGSGGGDPDNPYADLMQPRGVPGGGKDGRRLGGGAMDPGGSGGGQGFAAGGPDGEGGMMEGLGGGAAGGAGEGGFDGLGRDPPGGRNAGGRQQGMASGSKPGGRSGAPNLPPPPANPNAREFQDRALSIPEALGRPDDFFRGVPVSTKVGLDPSGRGLTPRSEEEMGRLAELLRQDDSRRLTIAPGSGRTHEDAGAEVKSFLVQKEHINPARIHVQPGPKRSGRGGDSPILWTDSRGTTHITNEEASGKAPGDHIESTDPREGERIEIRVLPEAPRKPRARRR